MTYYYVLELQDSVRQSLDQTTNPQDYEFYQSQLEV